MSDPQRYERIQQLFLKASDLSEADRIALLADCPLDERVEVELLLKHDASPLGLVESADSGAMINRLASGVFRPEAAHAVEAPLPDRIGRYRIIRRIGHGGMGVVYEAEQDEPRRRVAIKVLRQGSPSPAMIRRFRHEAQALGHLRHPGIAQIFEAGADSSGQPFLVMELIEGLALLEHAAAQRLDLTGKLQLIADICDAVHHAHQRGVIHRDLKPGNILVEAIETNSDAASVSQPRILDFGVARITDEDLRSVTQHTSVGEVMGTLPYMSPEQTLGDPNALDTRSDVYAIGVILFELLSGRLPIDVQQRSMQEAIRAVQSDEPSTLRSIDAGTQEDVETIVGKALEKDKSRRYQSAAELATDIRRFLSDQPILARPASAMYQIRKFARRNRAWVAGGAVAAVSLLLAAIISTTLAVLAVKAEREERAARKDAELARDEAEASSDFLADMLGAADPDKMGKDVRIIDVLAHATEEIDRRFPESPAVRAHLHRNIGITYRQLGMLDQSEVQLTAAVTDARSAYHRDHPALLRALNSLAVLYDEKGRYDQSVPIYEQVLAIQERTLGRSHRDTLGTACNLGLTLFDLERYDEARVMLEATQADMVRSLGLSDRFTINCVQGLGSVHLRQGRFDEATTAYQQALRAATEAFGPNDFRSIRALTSLSEVSIARDDAGRALEYIDDSLGRARIVMPADHWLIGRMTSLRGVYLMKLERFEESETALLQAHGSLLGTFEADDENPQFAVKSLVELYTAWAKPDSVAHWKAQLAPDAKGTTD